jgi:hypothetical protein
MSKSNKDQRKSAILGNARGLIVLASLIALVILGVSLLVARDDESAATTPAATSSLVATTSTRTSASKDEVTRRLQDILQIREQAIRERDASLFEDVYSSECSCLRAGRTAIAALKREKILWKNRSISIEVQSTKMISSRLWEVVALFTSSPFRIETEAGQLVRESPAERIRYRFLLVRTSDREPWRLGGASPIEG